MKKGGRRYFLDALIEQHQSDIEDLFKRLIAVEVLYLQQRGEAGELASPDRRDADRQRRSRSTRQRLNVAHHRSADKKSYIAAAEPTRYGHTGRLSYWMDQSGAIKQADNGGKPLQPK